GCQSETAIFRGDGNRGNGLLVGRAKGVKRHHRMSLGRAVDQQCSLDGVNLHPVGRGWSTTANQATQSYREDHLGNASIRPRALAVGIGPTRVHTLPPGCVASTW